MEMSSMVMAQLKAYKRCCSVGSYRFAAGVSTLLYCLTNGGVGEELWLHYRQQSQERRTKGKVEGTMCQRGHQRLPSDERCSDDIQRSKEAQLQIGAGCEHSKQSH